MFFFCFHIIAIEETPYKSQATKKNEGGTKANIQLDMCKQSIQFCTAWSGPQIIALVSGSVAQMIHPMSIIKVNGSLMIN